MILNIIYFKYLENELEIILIKRLYLIYFINLII